MRLLAILHTLGSITGYLVVYGIPVLVVSLLFGKQLLHRAGKNNKEAAKFGLGLFGVLTVIGLFLSIIALAVITHFDPHAANLLNKPILCSTFRLTLRG